MVRGGLAPSFVQIKNQEWILFPEQQVAIPYIISGEYTSDIQNLGRDTTKKTKHKTETVLDK